MSALEDSAVAAQDSLDFLARLSNEGGQSAEQLAEMASMIRTLSKEARAAIADAQAQKAELKEELDTAQRRLDDARARYAGYFNESVPRAEITVPVRVDDDGTVGFTFEYMAEGGGWTPTYTLHLDTEAEEMRIERKISVSQNTGEAWEDVRLSFSTQTLGGGLSPQDVPPYIRRIEEPMPLPIARDTARSQGMADTLMAAPSFSEMAASPKISNYGLNVTYDLAAPVTLLSDGLQSDFALDDLEVAPEVVLRAVPLFEETAYVMAEFTNESGEALLAGEAMAYRDGAFIGRVDLPMIVEGQETELGFGAVEGVTVSRVTLDRNEGDRGLIRKSNEDTSAVRLEVENLTGRSWPMEVIDRVSVSEQEDLLINWEASAPPTTVDRDDQRGVLAWEFDLDPSETWNVEVRETLTWPEDKVLR